ncbi:DUF1800 domain-containing protein [Paracoccus sp. 11-3]|uniref:DUF1800 domain-containing protein n=1 Tax=Paracoccus amoyensis TaxID=2760093 RepID=A0A926GA66_9RHOB|nr:DUF1800 domain-containing protein [Paracoccus amoyensis]MBC9247278.1 DUF1800 domain-containing protein [Paracoccus amoyensis]
MVEYSELAAIRLGYGLSPRVPSPTTPQELVDSIQKSRPTAQDLVTDEVRQFQIELQEIVRSDAPDKTMLARAHRRKGSQRRQLNIKRRFERAVANPGGFGERLVQFWADHFTVTGGLVVQSLMAEAFVTDAIRRNLTGKFADLMYAAETHPRMLSYLNQQQSVGENSLAAQRQPKRNMGINENLAREMIELHSLGVGADYTQDDVRQLAKLLTGLSYDPRSDRMFRPVRAEPGAETVLGKTYGGEGRAQVEDIRAVIGDLATHEATANHIARKLVVHFIDDDPPQQAVDRLAQVFRDTDGDLPSVYLALAESPELETHFRKKVRQPFDFMAASFRAVGFGRKKMQNLTLPQIRNQIMAGLAAMGQPWALPRGPDGWPEEAAAWATPQGIAARIDWANRELPKLQKQLPDPRDVLTNSLGSTATEPLEWAVPKAESQREGIAVVLGSADFNRR